MARLLIIRGAQLGIEYVLTGETLIGRSSDATVQLLDPSVSRRHALIYDEGGHTWVKNLSTGSVVTLNGVAIAGPSRLSPGDDLGIGGYGFVFEPELTLIRESYGDAYVVISPHPVEVTVPTTDGGLSPASLEVAAACFETCLTQDDLAQGFAGVLRTLVPHLGLRRGFVLRFAKRRHRVLASFGDANQVVSETIIKAVQTQRRALLSTDAASDVQLAAGLSVAEGRLRTVVAIPILAGDVVVGMLQADSNAADVRLPPDAPALLERLAAPLGRFMVRASRRASGAAATSSAHPTMAPPRLIASSPSMSALLDDISAAAATPATCLITGETGAGKEVVARLIHTRSDRAQGPFMAVNCAAIPESLIESELFGFEKGAFTGAMKTTPGKVELADGGTLFLDEIGDMSPHAQAKLLRFLQERVFYRVGAQRYTRVDVRIVAATNRDLLQRVTEGAFRQDLYYRLAVVPLTLPPLRERPEDIEALAQYFLDRFCRELKRPPMTLSADTLARMRAYRWPGNVRELMNLMERCAVLGRDAVALGPAAASAAATGTRAPASSDGRVAEIVEALRVHRGNKTKAAKALGISRPTLNKLIKRHDINIYQD